MPVIYSCTMTLMVQFLRYFNFEGKVNISLITELFSASLSYISAWLETLFKYPLSSLDFRCKTLKLILTKSVTIY